MGGDTLGTFIAVHPYTVQGDGIIGPWELENSPAGNRWIENMKSRGYQVYKLEEV